MSTDIRQSFLQYTYFGEHQCSIDATGKPLTEEATQAAINADAVLLGAIGGPVRFSKFTTRPLRTDDY